MQACMHPVFLCISDILVIYKLMFIAKAYSTFDLPLALTDVNSKVFLIVDDRQL